MPRRVLAMVLLLMLACNGYPYAEVPDFSVDVTWAGSQACFHPQCPPFTLSGIPPGAGKIRSTMTDLDAPNFVHGGGSVVYDGQRLFRAVPFFTMVRVRPAPTSVSIVD
jgi:hypothetical protein